MTYVITDNICKNTAQVDRFNARETLESWFDVEEEGVEDAIDNICDYIIGRLNNETLWGCDFLNVTIEAK